MCGIMKKIIKFGGNIYKMTGQKSIVLVPFPYSDQTGSKVRPALIISNQKFNSNDDAIICALTSSIKNRPYSLLISEKDTIHKRLRDECQVRVDALTRINKNLIIKEIDILNDMTFNKVLKMLDSIFN